VLLTVHADVHAAFRPGITCELPRSGHFQGAALMTLRAHGELDHSRTIQQEKLCELLAMNERDCDNFRAGYTQLFEHVLPPEVSLGNLPERIAAGARTFALSSSIVRDKVGAMSAVLFTLLDISKLIEAEVESLRGAAHVARFRTRFAEFAIGLHEKLNALTRSEPLSQANARLTLHTAKGVYAQFCLRVQARQIHKIEDKVEIDADDYVRWISRCRRWWSGTNRCGTSHCGAAKICTRSARAGCAT